MQDLREVIHRHDIEVAAVGHQRVCVIPQRLDADDRPTAGDQLRELKSKLEAIREAFAANDALHAERIRSPVIDVTAYVQRRGVAPVIETPHGELVITLEGGADEWSWDRLEAALFALWKVAARKVGA